MLKNIYFERILISNYNFWAYLTIKLIFSMIIIIKLIYTKFQILKLFHTKKLIYSYTQCATFRASPAPTLQSSTQPSTPTHRRLYRIHQHTQINHTHTQPPIRTPDRRYVLETYRRFPKMSDRSENFRNTAQPRRLRGWPEIDTPIFNPSLCNIYM